MNKKVCAVALTAAMMCSAMTAFAGTQDWPSEYWTIDSKYESAKNSKDYDTLIKLAKQEIDLVDPTPDDSSKYGLLASRYGDIIDAYEQLGDYEATLPYLDPYLKYAKKLNYEWLNVTEEKKTMYKPSLDLYRLTSDDNIYYGAKFEPKAGTYFGQVESGSESRDSMILIYQEYGESEYFGWLSNSLQYAEEGNKLVELALNFPGEGSQLDEIINDNDFLSGLCDIINQHPNLKIFLRIGAEANTWEDAPDVSKYKSAFRKIAVDVRNSCSNVATVWSMVHSSTADVDDFYPGDDYVDWVGISAYANKYFGAKRQTDNSADILYKSGDGAAPIMIVRNIVEKYGDRKPIMLAEGGSAYYTGGEVEEWHTDWAAQNLRSFYSTVMMKYPQVKLAAYFNTRVKDETSYYDLANCEKLKTAFDDMTSQPWFIQNGEDRAKSFKVISEGSSISANDTYEVYALPYVYADPDARVIFYIDGTENTRVTSPPYKTTLKLSGLSKGTHTLKAVMKSGEREVLSKEYKIVISEDGSTEAVDAPSTSSGGETDDSKNTASSSNGSFNDISSLNSVQKKAVSYAVSKGIINGYEDGTFRPNGSITRAEFATMVCRAYGYTLDGKCKFDDAKNHWASEYINACVKKGAINGVTDDTYEPDSPVRVAQASKILVVCDGMLSGDKEYPDAFVGMANSKGLYANTVFYDKKAKDTESDKLAVWQILEEADQALTRMDTAMMFYNIANQ